jgi:glyoxylase-like metal-dependent hydrolase (beta-lactamase superfamily II)
MNTNVHLNRDGGCDDAPGCCPCQFDPQPVIGDWIALRAMAPVPGLGALPINGFLWSGAEPMLVDTGPAMLASEWLPAIEAAIDPADIRWIWLSHTDADHVGNLPAVLDKAPRARVVTNGLGFAKMQLLGLPTDRVEVLEPGRDFVAGGRRFLPVRPPYYDAPETMGFFDPVDRVLFAADAFGALLSGPVEEAAAIPEAELRDGLLLWAGIDAPWLGQVDRGALGRTLRAIERLDPAAVLSGHLPVVRGDVARLTRILAGAYGRGVDVCADDLSMERLLQRAGAA